MTPTKPVFAADPAYKLEFESKIAKDLAGNPLKFYGLKDSSQYHTARYVAAGAQNIFSLCGVTPELIRAICDQAIKAFNERKFDQAAVWLNNLKYRTKYPVDEDACLRMAMILTFVEGENPVLPENHWTEYKLKALKDDPEAYSFFFRKGLINTPAYSEYLAEISPNSLLQRMETIKSLSPLP